jgi:MFS family permease
MPVEPTTLHRTRRYFPTGLPPSRFLAAVFALSGMQLMAAMDGPVAIFALPKIQNELGLSDAGRLWVVTGYVLTFGGLMLLGGRVGDIIGRKRTFIIGVVLFTIASAMCGIAWDGVALIVARGLHGAAAGIVAPNCLALLATTFPKGPVRNAAVAVSGAMSGVGAVMGLVLGGALTEVSWRLAFLVNVPIGLLTIYAAATVVPETQKKRIRLDATGAVLATSACTAAVVTLWLGPAYGWLSAATIGSGAVALGAFVAFTVVERMAENPIVPFNLFFDRNRLAMFATTFLNGGVTVTLVFLVSVYVQTMMGYSPAHAAIGFLPFSIAMATGVGASSRLVTWFPPRVVVFAGSIVLLGAMLYGSTLNRAMSYFPHLVLPIVVGGIGLGIIIVPLMLSLVASVPVDQLGPTSAIAAMLQILGAPVVLGAIQAVVTSRTLHLGGISGPVKFMNDAQLHALDRGYAYGLLWLAGVVVLLGAVALFMGYTAQQVAHAQQVTKAVDAEEL